MLQTQFAFRGKVYRGNRIPESLEHLREAARKILQVVCPDLSQNHVDQKAFYFTYALLEKSDANNQQEERAITDDSTLMAAINQTFKGEENSAKTIKFIINEQPPRTTSPIYESRNQQNERRQQLASSPALSSGFTFQNIPQINSNQAEMSFRVIQIKYPNNYMLLPDETQIVQEIILVNDGTVPWPIDTCMKLTDWPTDFEVTNVIHLGGGVPCSSKVKVNFKIQIKSKTRLKNEFSYQLCYG